jgi:two-component system LytT family sensor kinase
VAVVACTLLALSQSINIYTYSQAHYDQPLALALALIPALLVLMAACWLIVVRLAQVYPFAPQQRARSAVIHVAASFGFALVHNAALTLVFMLLLSPDAPDVHGFVGRLRSSFAYLFFQDVLAYGALLALCLALRDADLRAQLADARLTALRAQLNPHFFFNTLNAVSTLALQGRRDDVAEIVGRLGDLLRTALHEQSQEVPLSAELVFVEDYLAIQRVRFGDQLQVQKIVAPETLHAAVPTLMLQPILENVVEHGMRGDAGRLSVVITVSRRSDELLVEVTDSGPGFAAGGHREGIGLANTRARIQELYGTRSRFEYGNLTNGGAAVRISIPFRSVPSPAMDLRGARDDDGFDATEVKSSALEAQPGVARRHP